MINYLEIKKILEDDKIIIYPTEALYGLGCKFDSQRAIDNIYKIKGRNNNKPFLLLVGSFEMAQKIVEIDKKKKKFLEKYWPGHLTIIFNSRDKKETIAIRYPNTLFLNNLFEKINFPIVSTSVNRSGEIPSNDILEIKKLFSKDVDLIIDIKPDKIGKASTIIDFTKDIPSLIREGDISFSELLKDYKNYKEFIG